ncbi:MAG TPA: ankyrin repeat domain-containing protein [Candidatus Sulfotelmatobacter sp.]|nr:ankyrin repeat domain-containing protein [Candidatus Sulfotelmatobacter sp.]
MFPNPQAALPLPPRPNLEQYKKLAKELVGACKSGDANAIHDWAQHWIKALVKLAGLTITPQLPVRVDLWVEQVAEFARRKLSSPDPQAAKCVLADAQFVIARSHGFESWPKFARQVQDLGRTNSAITQFELAADAIVSGDAGTLERLLTKNPELVRERSRREHGATLLHYVAANGVEGYRQRSPKNAVQIAGILLQAGAEVDATTNVYGGGSTALSLAATSIHPLRAGVQNALLEMLLEHGTTVEDAVGGKGLVSACLANGRQGAAEFLASRGAPLDLEGAAGVGRLDAVKSFFMPDGSLKSPATVEHLQRGFLWACEFGRNEVVEFLLNKGADLGGQAGSGQTGLHWAVVGGQLSTIKLLLERGAPLEELNSYGATALGQALWSSINGDPDADYVAIVEALLAAGARVDVGSVEWLEKEWLEKRAGRSSAMKERIAEALGRYRSAD